ncbi:radical SAM protein [Paenibacillus rhizoplanae]
MSGDSKGPTKSKNIIAAGPGSDQKKIIVECSPGKPYYDFFGGEPLMYPWLSDILAMINHYGSIADFPTNGTLLEKHAEMLVETAPNKIWVSLDGPEEINDRQRGKGVFKKVIKGIEKLYELRQSKGKQFPKMGVSFIITPLNYMYIEEFFSLSISTCRCWTISVWKCSSMPRKSSMPNMWMFLERNSMCMKLRMPRGWSGRTSVRSARSIFPN